MKKTSLNPAALSTPTGYSHVTTISGGTAIYVSGQIAYDREGKIVGVGDIAAQARQVFENLKSALSAAGASFKDVVKLNSYVVNVTPERAGAIRTVRRDYFGDGPYPSSTMVGVTGLVHPDLLVEIEVIAFRPERSAAKAKKAPATRTAKRPVAKSAKKAARRR